MENDRLALTNHKIGRLDFYSASKRNPPTLSSTPKRKRSTRERRDYESSPVDSAMWAELNIDSKFEGIFVGNFLETSQAIIFN